MGSVMGRGVPLQSDAGCLSWRQPRGPGSWQALPLRSRIGRASWTAPPLRISPYLLQAFRPSLAGAAPLLLLVLGVLPILSHHGLSRDMEWSSLSSTGGPWCLSSLQKNRSHLLIPNSQPTLPLPSPSATARQGVCICFVDRFFCVTL